MNHNNEQNQETKAGAEKPVRSNADCTCDVCGKFGAYGLGDKFLCLDCYQERGSCCALEFEPAKGKTPQS